jgi:predicted PurR-regulated permease PerM
VNSPKGNLVTLPWDSLLIWAGLLLLLYALHEVFAIVFLTFLLVYLVRAIVVSLARRISPGAVRPGLESWLTLGTFAAIVALFWALASVIGPQLVQQGRLLMAHVQDVEPQEALDHVLARTIGAYLFGQSYGAPGDPRYQATFAQFTVQDRLGEGAFADFGRLQTQVQAGFEMAYEEARRAQLQHQMPKGGATSQRFEQWFLTVKAPPLVAAQRDAYLARLQAGADSPPPSDSGNLEHRLGKLALRDLDTQPAARAKLVEEWENAEATEQWQRLRASSAHGDAFRTWFDGPQGRALQIPYDADTYLALRSAYAEGAVAFKDVYQARKSRTPAGLDLIQLDFQRATELDLARHWWSVSPVAASLRAHLQQDATGAAESVANRLVAGLQGLIAVPAQVGTALLLTVLISFDMAGLKQGALRLRQSRLAGLYAKVIPNLVAVARLIGRSFAAQGLIAVFNTLLTLALMRLLGLGNELLLGSLVFITSFIPVFGVILSAIPIGAQALLQPDGSLTLALYALLGIGGIHLIESMVLSPRIVGRILHLHPVLVLAVLVVGEHLFGIWGLLLGVPIAVFAIHAGVLAEAIPGIYEPESDPAPQPAQLAPPQTDRPGG